MIDQILISKKIYSIGEGYSRQPDTFSAGIAISLFQDAVEQLTWCIIKHNNISVKATESFTSLLDKIDKSSDDALPHKAKILELNKARVGFKHYGNLPASSESEKFRSYAYDFLLITCKRYLKTDFEKVSEASLISNSIVRSHVEKAEKALIEGNLKNSLSETAIARFHLFQSLEKYVPKIDHNLEYVDQIFEKLPEFRGNRIQVFRYISQYLESVSRFNIAALVGGNIGEYLYFESVLPKVTIFVSGKTKVNFSHMIEPNEELAEKAIKYVVETAVRIEGVL